MIINVLFISMSKKNYQFKLRKNSIQYKNNDIYLWFQILQV